MFGDAKSIFLIGLLFIGLIVTVIMLLKFFGVLGKVHTGHSNSPSLTTRESMYTSLYRDP